MYLRVSERLGVFGDETGVRGLRLGQAAVAPPPPVVLLPALVIAALRALALLAAAIAATYLLIKAYEKAKSLGIGANWALEKATAGFQEVMKRARTLARELQRLIDEARASRRKLPPECENYIGMIAMRVAMLMDAIRRYHERATYPFVSMDVMKALLKVVEKNMVGLREALEIIRNCMAGKLFT